MEKLIQEIDMYSRRLYVKKWMLVNEHTKNPDEIIVFWEEMYNEALEHPDFEHRNNEFKFMHGANIDMKLEALGEITLKGQNKKTIRTLDIIKNRLYLCLDL